MKHERRNFTVKELRMNHADSGNTLVGHAAIFDSRSQDLGGFVEEIAKGAFSDAIVNDDVRALFNHDSNFVLGRNTAGTLKLSEDNAGLAIEISMPDTQYARDISASIDRGDIDQMSFGFSVRENGQVWFNEGDLTVRRLTSLNLFDVSPVTFPAYQDTDIAVRSMSSWKKTNVENLDCHKMRLELAEK